MLMKCQAVGTRWSAKLTTVANLRERRGLCGNVKGSCAVTSAQKRGVCCYHGGSGLARKPRKGSPAEATAELRPEWRVGCEVPRGWRKCPLHRERTVYRAGGRPLMREVRLAWQAGTLRAGIMALSSHNGEALPCFE